MRGLRTGRTSGRSNRAPATISIGVARPDVDELLVNAPLQLEAYLGAQNLRRGSLPPGRMALEASDD